jgi:hypothetical protein
LWGQRPVGWIKGLSIFTGYWRFVVERQLVLFEGGIVSKQL